MPSLKAAASASPPLLWEKVGARATTIALAAMLASCAATPPPQAGSISSKVEQQGQMTNAKITDMRSKQVNGLLVVQFEVTNPTIDNQQIYYRFKWLDASGFAVGDDEAWKPISLYGRQQQTLTVVAPSPKAKDFKLVLQSPYNIGILPRSQ